MTYEDWHDDGMYDVATEAQGMTLADLLHRQADEKGWPKGKMLLCSYLEGVVAGTNPVVEQDSRNNPLLIGNDLGEDFILQIYYQDNPVSSLTVRSGTSTSTNYGLDWSFRVDGKTVIQFYDEILPGYWSGYGPDRVDLPPDSPLCTALWDRICTRFNERYYKRYLAGETLDEWQRLLQVRTDEVVPRIERAMRLYAANDVDADVLATTLTEYLDVKDVSVGSGTGKITVTPDQSINDGDSYAGQTNKTEDTRTGTKSGKIRQTATGAGGKIPAINRSINEWMDLETLLIDRYNTCFMNYIWS